MFTSLCVISSIALICTLMNIDHDNDEIIYDADDNIDYEKETYDYFMGLSLYEQEEYFTHNADLNYYKDNRWYGLTDDRYINAKHAAEIARKYGRKFDNKRSKY